MIARRGKEKQNEKAKWGQSDGSAVKSTSCACRELEFCSQTTWCVTTIINSSSGGSKVLFWPLSNTIKNGIEWIHSFGQTGELFSAGLLLPHNSATVYGKDGAEARKPACVDSAEGPSDLS